MLWVDKHRPNTLDKLDINPELTLRLRAVAADGEIPHLLFYGPSGAGKKTRIQAVLREIYGPGVEKIRLEHKNFKTPSNRAIEVTTVASNYHIEMSPGDAGIYDRFIVQDVIKDIAQSQSLLVGGNIVAGATDAPGGGASSTSSDEKKPTFKVVILMGVDRLTKQAQAALRRTMEKYTASCRLILCCNSACKVIEPVRSRCLAMRVAAPSLVDIDRVLRTVAKKELGGSEPLPSVLATRIAMLSERNLRKALLMLETAHVQVGMAGLKADTKVTLTDWEMYISSISKDIVSQQTPQKLLEVRGKLYELLVNCIPADVILRKLLNDLLKMMDDELKPELTQLAALYEVRLHKGSKDIFHLEAFVANAMASYRRYTLSLFE